jgi:hypothetical protein
MERSACSKISRNTGAKARTAGAVLVVNLGMDGHQLAVSAVVDQAA